jgi:ABC-type branched-subunit amino acid transport system substrate-binding protein
MYPFRTRNLKRCRYRRWTGATAVVVVAGLVAGCGSSSHSSQSSSTTVASSASTASGAGASTSTSCSSSQNVRGVTSTEITVGGLVTVADFGMQLGKAAEARFAEANKDGEIPCGRKINLVETADDQASTTTNLSIIQRLVEEDHVFAIVPTDTPFIEAGETFVNQNHVPTLGWGISPSFCASPDKQSDMYIFGFNGCLSPGPPFTYQTLIVAPTLDKYFASSGGAQGKTVALIGDDLSPNIAGNKSISTQLTAGGFDVVDDQNPIPGAPAVVTDFTPYVEDVMTADHGKPPDVVVIVSGPTNLFPLVAGLERAGFKGLINHQTYAPQVVGPAKGTTATNTFATAETNTPAMKSIVATLHAAGVSVIGATELTAYISADYFVQLLKKVGPDLTPQHFQQVAANFTYEIPGVIGPVYYPAGFQAGPPCGTLVASNGTVWTVPVPYTCSTQDLKLVNGKYVPVPYPSGIT